MNLLLKISTLLLLMVSFTIHGQTTKRTLELPEFNKIYVNSNYTVYLKQTNAQEVKVEALTEIFDISEIKVEDGILMVNIDRKPESQNKSIWEKIDDIKLNPTINLMVNLKNVEELRVNGGGKIVSENSIAADHLVLSVSGNGSMNVDVKGESVEAEVSGAGSLTLKGYTTHLDLELSGSGAFNAFDCPIEDANVRVSGSGEAQLNVATSLDATIHGNGTIKHKGNTKTVSKKTYGSGMVIRAY